VQAVSQHRPSTQLPDVHWPVFWHCAPLAFLAKQTALVVSQYWVVEHGWVASQPPEHLTESAHWLLVQLTVIAVVHAPAPSHTVAVVAIPFKQLPAVHWVLLPGYWQRAGSIPLHCPAHDPVPAHAVRAARGVPITGTQRPGVLLSLHASHCPVQALSQHTPSTQCPDPHCPSRPHAAPWASMPASPSNVSDPASSPGPSTGPSPEASGGETYALSSTGSRPSCQQVLSTAQW